MKIFLKALLCQSLFFLFGTRSLHAQSIDITAPKPGEPLTETQTIKTSWVGPPPTRVELYLNDRLVLARSKPPFEFELRWDTKRENEVRVQAYFPEGATASDQIIYRPFQVDEAMAVVAFQCFPLLTREPEEWMLRSKGTRLEPETFARATLTLDLILVLDLSGSMLPLLEDLDGPLATFVQSIQDDGHHVSWLVFDSSPRRVEFPSHGKLRHLYRGQAKSVVWDALVTAATLHDATPRRIIVLVSDGADDGSRHDIQSAIPFLRRAGSALIWINPGERSNARLDRLATLSGGFTLRGNQWSDLLERIENQHHLIAPEAVYPIEFSVKPGRVWYPRWRE